jgi:hypothetical protein
MGLEQLELHYQYLPELGAEEILVREMELLLDGSLDEWKGVKKLCLVMWRELLLPAPLLRNH